MASLNSVYSHILQEICSGSTCGNCEWGDWRIEENSSGDLVIEWFDSDNGIWVPIVDISPDNVTINGNIFADNLGESSLGPTEFAMCESDRRPTLHLVDLTALADKNGILIYFANKLEDQSGLLSIDPLEQLLTEHGLNNNYL